MSSTSLGFLLPSPGCVVVEHYDFRVRGRSLLFDDDNDPQLWSENTPVTVQASFVIDYAQLLSDIGIPAGTETTDQIASCLTWRSTHTGLHGSSELFTVNDGQNNIELRLDSSVLGGDLIAKLKLVLQAEPPTAASPLAPKLIGCRLFETSFKLSLEGEGSQFPISKFDFSSADNFPDDAMWEISILPELDSHVSRAVRLKLNSEHSRIKQYFKSPNSKESQLFELFLKCDIALQMLSFAYQQDLPQLEQSAHEEGSLAEALLVIHGTYFPNRTMADVSREFSSRPSFVSSHIQAVVFSEDKEGNA